MKFNYKNLLIAGAVSTSLLLTGCSGDDMSLDNNKAVVKSIEGVPNNLQIPESKSKNLILNNNRYQDVQALFDSKEYGKSGMNALNTFLFRDLIEKTYSKDLDKKKLAKQLKHDLPNLDKKTKKNINSYKEYLKYKELTNLFLQDYFKKDLENVSINEYNALLYSYNVNSTSKEDAVALKKDFESNMSTEDLIKKYPSANVSELTLDTYPDFYTIDKLNSKNSNVNDVVEFTKKSLSNNNSRMKENEGNVYLAKVIDSKKVTIDKNNIDKYVLYLNSIKYGENEQKFYDYIKFLDKKLGNVDISKDFYIQLARETITYGDLLYQDLATICPIYSQKYFDLVTN